MLEDTTTDRRIVHLTGASGVGKTATVAAICRRAQEDDPDMVAAVHFVGCTADSTSLHAVLLNICQQLARAFNIQPGDITDIAAASINELQQLLADSVAAAAQQCGGRTLVAIDALDQLDEADQAQALAWLPKSIPTSISFLLSTAGGVSRDALDRHPLAAELEAAPLSLHDRSEFVRARLAVYRKTLDETPFNNQLKLLVTKKEGGNPLFLTLACEELRLSGVYEKLTGRIKAR